MGGGKVEEQKLLYTLCEKHSQIRRYMRPIQHWLIVSFYSFLFAQDILRCRVLTSGIFETKFVVEKVHFQ